MPPKGGVPFFFIRKPAALRKKREHGRLFGISIRAPGRRRCIFIRGCAALKLLS